MMDRKRVDVGTEGVEEVIADSRLLLFVESIIVEEVFLRAVENHDFHAILDLNSFFT